MIADENDTGENFSPSNRTRSGTSLVAGNAGGKRRTSVAASGEGLDVDRICGNGSSGKFVVDRWIRRPKTADETPTDSPIEEIFYD